MTQSNNSVPFTNTYWVISGLFLAGEHPVEVTKDITIARLNALLDAGVRTFVNLTEERKKMQNYSDLLRTMAIDRHIDIEIFQKPIPDRNIPSAEMLTSILDVIDLSLANKKPIFIHCFAGIGRTGTIVGCHLIATRGRRSGTSSPRFLNCGGYCQGRASLHRTRLNKFNSSKIGKLDHDLWQCA